MNHLSSFLTLAALIAAPLTVSSQVTRLLPQVTRSIIYNYVPADTTLLDLTALPETGDEPEINLMFFDGEEMTVEHDSVYIHDDMGTVTDSTIVLFSDSVPFVFSTFNPYPIPTSYFRPAVFDKLHLFDPIELDAHTEPVPGIDPLVTEWLSRSVAQNDIMRRVKQNYIVNNPDLVKYDEAHLPEPPKKYTATVDPNSARILLKEVVTNEMPVADLQAKFDKKHWLRSFNGNLQFSQAYVSPNWYQGGNDNLNALLHLYYNVKLNPAFHEKLLFENTFQYKLGVNNAPDDEVRNYSISEDLFQWNMTAGYRSTKRWYYSMTAQLKTQFLNNYKSNSTTLKAAFMSPGELNVGVGMTYNYANKKKTFTFDASISPLSYNLKTCFRKRLSVKGIEPGHTSVSEYGSSGEGKLQWQMCENISLRSRLFVFTDYDYIQSDWENTLQFTINRFLTTQIYVHMRYDSSSPVIEDTDWHKLQLKEILSIGFTYKFGNS
ncbi:MAG: DUF3078 domain-containing protein [Paenibacillus sp.]|nr:DUF3078 domain-containing protein [Paenibacillus sp.]